MISKLVIGDWWPEGSIAQALAWVWSLAIFSAPVRAIAGAIFFSSGGFEHKIQGGGLNLGVGNLFLLSR